MRGNGLNKAKCKYTGATALVAEYNSYGRTKEVCLGWHVQGKPAKACRKCDMYIDKEKQSISVKDC